MTVQKIVQPPSLSTLIADKTRLNLFFDHLMAHYDGLSEPKKRDFLRRLLNWHDWDSSAGAIFNSAYNIDHDKVLALLMNTRIYRQPYRPIEAKEAIPHPNYYKHLKSIYLSSKAPFKAQVYKSLARIPGFPDALKSLIMDYNLHIPTDPALALIEEVPEENDPGLASQKNTHHRPGDLSQEQRLKPEAKSEMKETPVEEALERKALGKHLDHHNALKKKYFLSLLALFMLGLTAFALFIASAVLMGLVLPIVPYAMFIAFSVFLGIALILSLGLSIFSIEIPILSLVYSAKAADKTEHYKHDTKLLNNVIFGVLIGLTAVSLIAFTIGLIALLPPLGLSIPILAWTLGSGGVLAASLTTLGIFGSHKRKERQAHKEFVEVLSDCAAPAMATP